MAIDPQELVEDLQAALSRMNTTLERIADSNEAIKKLLEKQK